MTWTLLPLRIVGAFAFLGAAFALTFGLDLDGGVAGIHEQVRPICPFCQ